MWERACVGAGLPAMRTPRSMSDTEVMLSRASPAPTQACSHIFLCPVIRFVCRNIRYTEFSHIISDNSPRFISV
ncbi:hypothetical protein DBR46_28575 [Pseudomonas sp. KBW05]|nr:hypothetical protein DBR46_28575 [Pseudomonas sp. KBW05]